LLRNLDITILSFGEILILGMGRGEYAELC
jgi:hypothetical protein